MKEFLNRILKNRGVHEYGTVHGVFATPDWRCIVLERDGRTLPELCDGCVSCIVTDHPWKDDKANHGGNRNFTPYECFLYEDTDFVEKARLLRQGCFLCEIIPAENATNYDYLYNIKKMAERAGFLYYAKVPWKKGNIVSNTGRKAKNTEDVMIFSKGKARSLRQSAYGTFFSGTDGMLPTVFDVPPVPSTSRICKGEKPVELFEHILQFLTLSNEVVLDQFAGSGAVGVACLSQGRRCLLVEKSEEQILAIRKRLSAEPVSIVL